MATPNTNGSILDLILEKTSNIEQTTNSINIKGTLNELIRVHAKRERNIRESAISIKPTENFEFKEISKKIEDEWVDKQNQAPVTFWKDNDFVYAQFTTKNMKNSFLDYTAINWPSDLKERISKPDENGHHMKRKGIRVIINNVRGNIQAEKVRTILISILSNSQGEIFDFREGKTHQVSLSRSIMFKTNSEGFKILFGQLDGGLPYSNSLTGTKTRLFMRINLKPFVCRECFTVGIHQCQGQICGQCSGKGHQTKDCKQKTKFCGNCKKNGHRPKDTHCPYYLGEIAKEIRKVDIPLEHFEDANLRFSLTKNVQLS